MGLILSAFASGLLFGIGLIVSQMVNPSKVLGFLDIFGSWDPSLALVMGAAVAVAALGAWAAARWHAPIFEKRLLVPQRHDLDPRLIAGASLFGIGWGLVGLCPGPALTILPVGPPDIIVFTAAMLVGMGLYAVFPATWPRIPFRQQPQGADG
jgi:uncharacterized membrane protein YedE/YeeE